MKNLTDEQIAALEALLAKATPGEWAVTTRTLRQTELGKEKFPKNEHPPRETWLHTAENHPQLKAPLPIVTISVGPYYEPSHALSMSQEDAEHIAALHNSAPVLLSMAKWANAMDWAVDSIGDGAGLITAERWRQVSAEGWTPEHDDKHADGEMAMAAACYATPVPIRAEVPVEMQPCGCRSAGECMHGLFPKMAWRDPWPWDGKWDKRGKHNRIRQLVIAGSLIAAEIDRLKRAESRPNSK